MKKRCLAQGFLAAGLLALALGAATSRAAVPIDVVTVDFTRAIDQVAARSERFAIQVPYSANLQANGGWMSSGGTRTWQWKVQVPGAVSLSFHAAHASLPAGASLAVSGGGRTYTYGPGSVHRGELWSRIAHGDSLDFTLTVNAADAGSAVLAIDGLQAGFRSLGGAGPNHPHYDALQRAAAAGTSTTTTCVENFECHVTSADDGPGQASVALVIQNVGLCSGVMLNDVPGDGAPYVLTARHCENDNPDGGAPGAAAGVTAFFDATTTCGQPLELVYDTSAPAVTGAVTVVEQQDSWLIRLDAVPPVTDIYYAGWDATGGVFNGGYTTSYGEGNTRQFTGWYGQAYYAVVAGSSLDVLYTSTFWELVNEVGSISPGSSGSGVFDANNHLRGIVVRGEAQSSATNSPGVCPMTSPPAPSPSTATGYATALSGIFDSTADPESTTGGKTLRMVLDPKDTGTQILNGRWNPVSISASSLSAQTGSPVSLTWRAPGATSCTASGGEAGDGWSGTLAASGSQAVDEYTPKAVTYVIACATGAVTASASVTVTWSPGAVAATLQILPGYGSAVGDPISLAWNSSVSPCTATGGAPGDGWAGPISTQGSKDVNEASPGTYKYAIACGSGSKTASAQVQFTVTPLVASLKDGGITSSPIGVPVTLTGSAAGNYCTTSGGAPGDGWAGIDFIALGNTYRVVAPSPGTYTYTLSCFAENKTVTASVTISWTNGPPAVNLFSTSSAPPVGGTIDVTWVATVAPCTLTINGIGKDYSQDGLSYTGYVPEGEIIIGKYTYAMTCGSGSTVASTTLVINWGGTPQLTFSPILSPMVVGSTDNTGLQWNSNSAPCAASGGVPGDGWSGNALPADAYKLVTDKAVGTYHYTLTCGSGSQTVQAKATLVITPGPAVATLKASPMTASEGGAPITLTWTSNTSPCWQSGPDGSGTWGNSQASSGSETVGQAVPGTVTYGITCGSGTTTTASAQVDVTFTGPAPPTFTSSASEVVAGTPYTLSWASADGSTCTGSGGGFMDAWNGPHPPSGTLQMIDVIPGSYQFLISCGIAERSVVGVRVDPMPYTDPPPPTTLPNDTAGLLSIPQLKLGNNMVFSDLVVSYSQIVSGPIGAVPSGPIGYNQSNNQLTLPAVTMGGNTYYNVVVTVGRLISAASVVGADTYYGDYLRVVFVEVNDGTTYGGASYDAYITVDKVISIAGGMPTGTTDQYNIFNRQLFIPAVQVGNTVYTNVTVAVGQLLGRDGLLQ